MAKKNKNTLKIYDFFGIYNTYRIFALQSELSAFPFANLLGKLENTTFTLLPDFEYISDKFSAHFTVFYAEFAQTDSIHCLLLENKTIRFNQHDYYISKSERKLSFQTLSLFDEWLYLFNKEGLHCFDAAFTNIDYLLLLYAKKDIDSEIFERFLNNIAPLKVQDASDLLIKENRVTSFLRDFYCKHEVTTNLLSIRKKMDLLAPVKQIPKQNLHEPLNIMFDNEAVTDNMRISEEYLTLLAGDC